MNKVVDREVKPNSHNVSIIVDTFFVYMHLKPYAAKACFVVFMYIPLMLDAHITASPWTKCSLTNISKSGYNALLYSFCST